MIHINKTYPYLYNLQLLLFTYKLKAVDVGFHCVQPNLLVWFAYSFCIMYSLSGCVANVNLFSIPFWLYCSVLCA